VQEFHDGGHNEGKVFDEKLGHPIEDLYVLWRFQCGHIHDFQNIFQIN
jgi:hypothetical protein